MDTSAVTAWLATWASHHPFIFTFCVVPLVLAVANGIIALLTSKRWEQLLANYPRFAAVCKLAGKAGVDPVGIVKWAVVLITGKPFPEPPKDEPKDGDGGATSGGGTRVALKKSSGSNAAQRLGMAWLFPRPFRIVYGNAVLGAVLVAAFMSVSSCSAGQKRVEQVVVNKGDEACLAISPGNPFCTAVENFEPFIPFIQDLVSKREEAAKSGKAGGAKAFKVTCTVSP